MNQIDKKALKGARNAIERGLRVLPLSSHVVIDRNGQEVWTKVPRIEKWQYLATDDADTLMRWAGGDFEGTSSKSKKPCSHWGASLDGFIAFDTDAPAALEALKEIFKQAGFPGIVPTYTVRTGRGGNHFLYRQPEGYALGNSTSALAPKLDTRGGAGGFVVLPGTTNPATGGEYSIVCDAEIAELPVAVAEAIKSKVAKAKKKDAVSVTERRSGSVPDTPLKIQRATEFLLRKTGGVEGEGGDADAVYVGRTLADIGLSEDRAKALAFSIYNPKCCPEWDEDELSSKIHNGFAYRESPVGCEDPDLAIAMFSDLSPDNEIKLEPGDEEALPFESMAKFRATPPEPRHSLIEGFMAHGKYLTLVYGRGGSGKSLLMHQMLRELSRNRSFLGMAPGDVCSSLRAAILSCEEPEEDVHFRYAEQSKRIDPEGGGEEPIWCNLRGKDATLFTRTKNGIIPSELFYRLVRRIKCVRVNTLLVDSLSRIFPGNEIDRADVTEFGKAMDMLCMETGCHVIVLAHTNKEGGFSGSSAWEAICRQMFIIRSESDDLYSMRVEKTNEGKRGAEVFYRFDNWYFVPVSAEEVEALDRERKQEAAEEKRQAHEDAANRALIDLVSILENAGGTMKNKDLEAEMGAYGYNRSVSRAARDLGVQFGDLTVRRDKPDENKNYPLYVSLVKKLIG